MQRGRRKTTLVMVKTLTVKVPNVDVMQLDRREYTVVWDEREEGWREALDEDDWLTNITMGVGQGWRELERKMERKIKLTKVKWWNYLNHKIQVWEDWVEDGGYGIFCGSVGHVSILVRILAGRGVVWHRPKCFFLSHYFLNEAWCISVLSTIISTVNLSQWHYASSASQSLKVVFFSCHSKLTLTDVWEHLG